MIGKWLEAAKDLRCACQIDYDEETNALRKEVDEKAHKIEEKQREAERAKSQQEEREKENRTKAYYERVMRYEQNR